MRVIAGIAKGRRLESAVGDETRPITDRVKEALFNILMPYLEGAVFLDLFAGTGSVGIEALSRGAEKCYFLEVNRKAYDACRKNIDHCGFSEQGELRNADAFAYLKSAKKSFDIIFIDPPQFKNMWVEVLKMIAERPNLLKNEAMVIVKIHPKEYEEFSSSTLEEYRVSKYGNNSLVFYRLKSH